MAWDAIGNVTIDADSVQTDLSDWESTNTPTSIDEWELTKQGTNRCLITIQYTE